MITQHKKLMTYTYFNHNPGWNLRTNHLFSPARKDIPLMTRVPFPTIVVDLKNPDFIKLWSSSTRTKINKAIRENLTADRGNYLLPDILKLFSATADRKGLRGYTPEDFDKLFPIESSAVFYEEVMLCGHIWLMDKEEQRALLYVNASNHHNQNEDTSLTGRAHYFLLWQDGIYLKQLGIETMDLMGYESDAKHPWLKGIYQWKAGTHGKKEVLYHYYPGWFYVLRKFRNMLTG
jgi:hypothetical protein